MVSQVILNLLLVLSLAMACFYVAKKIKQRNPVGGGGINTRAVLSLGSKEKIVLLEVLGEHVLVGVTPNQMTTLKCFGSVGVNPSSVVSDSLNSFSVLMQKKDSRLSEAPQ